MYSFFRHGFLLLLLFLPLQTVYLLREPIINGEKWQYGTIGIYATDILLILVLGGYCARYFVRRRTKSNFEGRKRSFSLLFARKQRASEKSVFAPRLFLKSFLCSPHISTRMWSVFFLWTGFSIFWAPDQILAWYFLVKLLLVGGVFFLIRLFSKREIGLIITVLFTGAVLESMLGIGQFLSQSTFVSSWLGMSGYEAWQAGTSVLKNESSRWLRAYGTFPHPNMLGGYLGVMLVLGMGYLTQSVLSMKKRLLFWGGGVIILLGLILTFSRTAWIGTTLGMGLLIMAHCRLLCARFRSRLPVDIPDTDAEVSRDTSLPFLRKTILILRSLSDNGLFSKVMVVLGAATIVFVGVLHETIFPRFESRSIQYEGSLSERARSFQDAFDVIHANNMWLGVGAGNMTGAVHQLEPERPLWSIQPVHNVFMLVWTELGVVGTFLLLVGIFLILKSSVLRITWHMLSKRKYHAKKHLSLSLVSACALAVLIPSLFLDHWLISSHFGLFFLGLLLGLNTAREESDRLMIC